MIAPKVDRRIQRTERLLMDALIALALEKGYETITIRDITERADVSYSTFFRHYAEKDELLTEVLKQAIDDFKALINQSDNPSRETEGRLIFEHVAANQAFFRVLFSSPGATGVMQTIRAEIAAEIQRSRAIPASSPIPPEIAANHFAATVLALIRWWLEHDLPYPVEQMAAIYNRLIVQGMAQVVAPE